MSLCIKYIPFAFDLDCIVGVTIPPAIGAESVGAFQPDSLTHIVGFQSVIYAGAPAVFRYPIIDRSCLAVVGSVVLEVSADLNIVGRRGVGFLKIFDHSCKAGNVRHLNEGDSILDHGGGRF